MAWVLGVATRTELALSIAVDFLRGGEKDINNKRVAAQEIVLKTQRTLSGGMSISLCGVGFFGGWGVSKNNFALILQKIFPLALLCK